MLTVVAVPADVQVGDIVHGPEWIGRVHEIIRDRFVWVKTLSGQDIVLYRYTTWAWAQQSQAMSLKDVLEKGIERLRNTKAIYPDTRKAPCLGCKYDDFNEGGALAHLGPCWSRRVCSEESCPDRVIHPDLITGGGSIAEQDSQRVNLHQ